MDASTRVRLKGAKGMVALCAALSFQLALPAAARADDPPPPPEQPPPARYPAAQPGYPAPPPGYAAPPPGYAAPPPGYVPPPGWVPQQQPPLRYEMQPRWGLFAAGAGVFGGTYLFSALLGGFIAEEPAFYAPIVGPIIFAAGQGNTTSAKVWTAYCVLDFLAQAAGASMMIAGLVAKKKVAVRDLPVSIAPVASPSLTGLVLSGRF